MQNGHILNGEQIPRHVIGCIPFRMAQLFGGLQLNTADERANQQSIPNTC